MPEIKDYITYGLALLGIIITGIFSGLVYWVSKKSAEATEATAELAKQTFELNKTIIQKENESKEALYQKMKGIYQKQLELDIFTALQFIFMDLDKQIASAKMFKNPFDIPDTELATYFSKDEAEKVHQAFTALALYVHMLHTISLAEVRFEEFRVLSGVSIEELETTGHRLQIEFKELAGIFKVSNNYHAP